MSEPIKWLPDYMPGTMERPAILSKMAVYEVPPELPEDSSVGLMAYKVCAGDDLQLIVRGKGQWFDFGEPTPWPDWRNFVWEITPDMSEAEQELAVKWNNLINN